MGYQIIKQPDGHFALFSSYTDTEWGVCFHRGDYTEVHQRDSQEDAEEFMALFEPGDAATIVSRTVTRTEWREMSEGGAPDA